ncbi:MAG: Sip1-related alpha-galactosidase [Akkermansia sp.]
MNYCSFIKYCCCICCCVLVQLSVNAEQVLTIAPQVIQPQSGKDALISHVLTLPEIEQICWFAVDAGRWPAEGNRELPWVGDHDLKALLERSPNPVVKKPEDRGMLAIIRVAPQRVKQGVAPYIVLMPLPSENLISWLRITKEGKLACETGTLGIAPVLLKKEVTTMVYGYGDTPAEACRQAWGRVQNVLNKGKGSWRKNKYYPEPFCYLGWCSWEQYKKNINEKLLLDVTQRIEQSPLPIRWILIDDGFQKQKGDKLQSFTPSPKTFPSQWKNLLALRSDKIKWFGLWHCYHGLWGGINRQNDFSSELNKGFIDNGSALFPGKTQRDAQRFYDAYMDSVQKYGFNFVKIDVQCEYLKHTRGQANPAMMNRWCTQALENSCRLHKLSLLNCMALNPVSPFHTKYSNITRCSLDYHLGDANHAKSHIYQSFQNTLWLGQSVWPDHDMFHSSDPMCGRLMAVSKALSGGPVYLSDAPEQFKTENIWPLVLSDGRILRPLAPAVPTPDSTFINVFDTQQPYKVIAPLPNQSAAIASYNLNTNPNTMVNGVITMADYQSRNLMDKESPPSIAQGSVAVYDFYAGRGTTLKNSSSSLPQQIAGFSDRLHLLVPIKNGWAVIGRSDKFLSPCTVSNIKVREDALSFNLVERGPVVIYCEKGEPVLQIPKGKVPIVDLGGGYYRIDFSKNKSKVALTFTVNLRG